jgi:hypothetical protein
MRRMQGIRTTLRTLRRCYVMALAYESGEMSLADLHAAMTAPEETHGTGENASAARVTPSLAA